MIYKATGKEVIWAIVGRAEQGGVKALLAFGNL